MTLERHADDAPLTASKRKDAVDTLTAAIPDAHGASTSGTAVTINRPVDEVFAYFRDFSNLPTFMENVVSIEPLDDSRLHWIVKAPADKTVEWDARITEDVANERIAWTSEPGADIANSGLVTFEYAEKRGTVVTATILYDPPAGIVGKLIAKVFQREPAIQARRDLRRFKQLMETGEIATAAMNTKQHAEENN